MILHEGLWKWRSSHKTKLQVQWGKSSPLCKYMSTIYSSLLSYQGIFSASRKKKRKKATLSKWIYSKWRAWLVPGSNGQFLLHWTRVPEKSYPKTLSHTLLGSCRYRGSLETFTCIQSLKQGKTNLLMSECPNVIRAGQWCSQYNQVFIKFILN